MKFSGLGPGRVRSYIGAVRGGPLWIFQHIPKTAGSSLATELARYRAPYKNLFLEYEDKTRTPVEKRERLVAGFLEAHGRTPYRAVSGHLRRPNIDALIAALPEARLLTFVRDPVERVLSTYRYLLSPAHNDPQKFAVRFPTLLDYVRAPISRNLMTKFITGEGRGDPAEIVAFAFERFAFIGSQNLYDLSFRLMSALLWEETAPTVRANVTAGEHPAADRETVELIRRNNRLDQALYDAVMQVYRDCGGEIEAELAALAAGRQRRRA